jgi:molybdopterin molybdotransferase
LGNALIHFDEAFALLAAAAVPLESERVPIGMAHGRVLASDVHANLSAPPRDVSAMDGYAVRDTDLRAGGAVRLRVAGDSFAGSGHDRRLGTGECIRIFTGAPIPSGADRVVVQEVVTREGDLALFQGALGPSRHIRTRGSDFSEGDLLLPAGRLLDYRALVAAAGGDLAHLDVRRRPRLAVLSTGDELADPGTARGMQDRVPESVSLGVLALARDWGAEPLARVRVADDLPRMERAAAEAVEAADLVVVTGGASVGDRDFARAMFAPLGLDLLFSKVAMKPGKPVWFGRVRDTLVLGLPGNPTAALLTARLFLAPLVAGLTGRDAAEALRWRPVVLGAPLPPAGERETFVRARWNGAVAHPVGNQDTSMQKMFADASLLLRRPAGAPGAEAGDRVDALDL